MFLSAVMIGQPLLPVFAQETEEMGGPPPATGEKPGMNGEGMMPRKPNGPEPTCFNVVNKNREQAQRELQQRYSKSMGDLKLKFRSDMEAARKIENEDQREAAMDAAEDAFNDARIKLEQEHRQAVRKLTLQHRGDMKTCRDKQKEQDSCLRVSQKKMDEAMRAAQTV